MAHPFEVTDEIQVDATPEQVWDAIATGPGHRLLVHGRERDRAAGGRRDPDAAPRLLGGGHRRPRGSRRRGSRAAPPKAEDGALHAFEYLVEGRDKGSTVVRWVHSGFLGDNWEAEYEGADRGRPDVLRQAPHVPHVLPGRKATPVNVFGGPWCDRDAGVGDVLPRARARGCPSARRHGPPHARRAPGASTVSSTTCRRASSVCAPTTGCTGSCTRVFGGPVGRRPPHLRRRSGSEGDRAKPGSPGSRSCSPSLEAKEVAMETVTSRDGTTIAFDRLGEGPPVVLVSRRVGRSHVERAHRAGAGVRLHRPQLRPTRPRRRAATRRRTRSSARSRTSRRCSRPPAARRTCTESSSGAALGPPCGGERAAGHEARALGAAVHPRRERPGRRRTRSSSTRRWSPRAAGATRSSTS